MEQYLECSRRKLFRWGLLTILGFVLFIIGYFEDFIKVELPVLLANHLDSLTQLNSLIALLQETTLANLLYRVVYCSVCLAFIHAYFRQATITKLSMWSFIFLILFMLLLYSIADRLQLYQLRTVAFRIDSLIVSPFLLIILIPALHLTSHKS